MNKLEFLTELKNFSHLPFNSKVKVTRDLLFTNSLSDINELFKINKIIDYKIIEEHYTYLTHFKE